MNYANDSAPLQFASAMNAPVTSGLLFHYTSFGYGPLSDIKNIVELKEDLYDCRPCGLHGYQACPEGHFLCARNRWCTIVGNIALIIISRKSHILNQHLLCDPSCLKSLGGNSFLTFALMHIQFSKKKHRSSNSRQGSRCISLTLLYYWRIVREPPYNRDKQKMRIL